MSHNIQQYFAGTEPETFTIDELNICAKYNQYLNRVVKRINEIVKGRVYGKVTHATFNDNVAYVTSGDYFRGEYEEVSYIFPFESLKDKDTFETWFDADKKKKEELSKESARQYVENIMKSEEERERETYKRLKTKFEGLVPVTPNE
jgi:hypothetical protein